jgi:hypothetical protein
MTQAHDGAAIARDVLRRGYKPVPVPIGGKGPVLSKWQKLDVTPDTVGRYFDGGENCGVILGPRSGNLADVDLDCEEAVALAPHFLPRTGSIYGRAGKRRSHYLYKCGDPPAKAAVKLLDEARAVIVEVRVGGGGKGVQSIWPGSLHPSGERYAFDEDGEPRRVDFADLDFAARKIAVGSLLVRHWPETNRHEAAMRVGGFLARVGWSETNIAGFIVATQEAAGVADPGHVENGRLAAVDAARNHAETGGGYGLPALVDFFGDAVARAIAKIVGYRGRAAPEPTSPDGRPLIQVEGGSLSANADEAEAALIDAGVAFYERSNTLVRPIVKDVDGFHGKQTKTAQLASVRTAYLRDVLGRHAHWRKFDRRAREWVRCDPPKDTADTVLARAGEWGFPTIAGIINTPTLRPDGSILDQAGFDPATRLLLLDPPPMAPIPDKPTPADARTALKLLRDLIKGFPLVGEVDRAVMLSTLITPVARGNFSVAPLHAIDAPVAGSGKSYGHDCAAVIATGQRMPVIAAGRDEEESEKRLGSALLAGQPLVCVDNLSGALSGDALCQYVERPRPLVRVLGRSELIPVETRGTTFFANGNNLVIVGDVCRRVVRARLDAKMEDPELREFKTNPLAMIAADRGAYVRACLTICRAYVAAGRPKPARRLASFEGWSDTVRSALIWLGEADPVKSMTAAKAEDPERAAFRDLLAAWAAAIGTGEATKKTLKDVVAIAVEKTTHGGAEEATFVNGDFNAALQAAVNANGARYRPLTASSLGYWLRARKDAIVGDHRFRHEEASNVGYWWIEKIGQTDDRAAPATAEVEEAF